MRKGSIWGAERTMSVGFWTFSVFFGGGMVVVVVVVVVVHMPKVESGKSIKSNRNA